MDKIEICKRCGKRSFIGSDGLCADCREDIFALMDLEEGETEFVGEEEPRCPWCAQRVDLGDPAYIRDGMHTCPHCGRDFSLSVNITYSFSSWRAE